jgi:hypothetical protein
MQPMCAQCDTCVRYVCDQRALMCNQCATIVQVRVMPCAHAACKLCLDMWFDHNAAELVRIFLLTCDQ